MSRIGTIGWRELMTPKPEQSEKFYRELFGWAIRAVPMGPGTYRLCDIGKKEIAGIMQFDKPGIPAHWVSYVTVADVDATANAATKAGGKVANPPMDIPNVGRFAVIMDPFGGVTVPFKSANAEQPSSNDRPHPGEFCWETLMAPDAGKAAAFYKQVYGWTTKPMDGGDTQLFYAGDRMLADIEKTPPGVPPSWLTYVLVPKLAEARDKVKKLGGKILMEEVEVPKMGVFSVVQDDVGAAIGLFEPRM